MVKIADIRFDEISEDKARRYFGYTDTKPPSARTQSIMANERAWLLSNAEPKGVYGIFPCSMVDRDHVLIANEIFESRVFRLHMDGSQAAGVMAVTMGLKVDERISQIMEDGNAAQGYILNGLAAASADCVADTVETLIKDELDLAGLKTTLRYSPGYADFLLENQRSIFNLIDPGKIGIVLNESFLMKPIKSITAVIGIGSDVVTDRYPCELCDKCNITTCKFV